MKLKYKLNLDLSNVKMIGYLKGQNLKHNGQRIEQLRKKHVLKLKYKIKKLHLNKLLEGEGYKLKLQLKRLLIMISYKNPEFRLKCSQPKWQNNKL